MLQESTIRFLKLLDKNNNRAWFEKHRNEFEHARDDFEKFTQVLIDRLGKKDPDIAPLEAKKCVFRQYRDIRFSKDKTPYKNNMGAYMNKGGKKSIYGGYYIHCQPGQSFLGGGVWMPQPGELKKIRQEIDYNFQEFSSIIHSRKFKSQFKGLSTDDEFVLSRLPKGYEPDNPAAEFLKFKSFVVTVPLTDSDFTSKQLVTKCMKAFETLMPLVKFLNRSFHEES